MAHGFVYVLSNESMPGIYKIGMTLGHPKERMAQLSAATACPTPFELEAFIGCENPRSVEAEIHASLDKYRVNEAREFFRVDPALIQDQLRRFGDQFEDVVWEHRLEWAIDVRQIQERQRWLLDHFFSQCADPLDLTSLNEGFN